MRGKLNKIIYGIVIFAIYSFELTMTLQLNDRVVGDMNSAYHYAGSVILGIGFLLFYLSRKFIESDKIRKIITLLVTFLYSAAMLFRVRVYDGFFVALICSACIGFLGGMVYYMLAVLGSIIGFSGIILAFGSSLAFLLQFLLQGFIDKPVIIYAVIIAGLLIMTVSFIYPMGDFVFENMLPYTDVSEDWNGFVRKRLVRHTGLSILVLCISLVCELQYIASPNVAAGLYGVPRLFLPIGYFIIAIAGDAFGFRMAEVVMLCVSLTSFAAMPHSDFLTGRMSLFYILAGATMAFITMGYWNIAPKTEKPDLWAVFGRIIAIFEGLLAYVLIFAVNAGEFMTMVLVALLLMGLFILFMDYKEKVPETSQEEVKEDENTTFEAFADHYRLTPKEQDVMHALLKSDAKLKVIAEEINTSERMIYRYMNQLYVKTGAENRAGLVKSYYDYEKNRSLS
ncbi:helix-turn-helix transcriptional regulator [Butyrivibrio sp. MB2005]|uniref:helix-turn-helix transcriptional regulator n=1 Tax=Butyrivibrio sp. MB2005 TaxID=1280678 RepID=UPI0003F83D4E|nr:hypothetical protein [Butyrivibrio sp. MB2005]